MKPTRKKDALGWLRAQCRRLDAVEETIAWGHPTFRAGGRMIAAYEICRGRPSIAVLSDLERQDMLIEQFGFYKTPYAGRFGWVSMWVDGPVPWDLLASLLKDAHGSVTARVRRRRKR